MVGLIRARYSPHELTIERSILTVPENPVNKTKIAAVIDIKSAQTSSKRQVEQL